MDDVVEQGRRDRRAPPRWLRGSGLAVALTLVVLVVTRPHLLSAGSTPHRPSAAQRANPTPPGPPGQNTSQGISIVVRQGDRLERYVAGSGVQPLATLPRGLADAAPLVYLPRRGGSGTLVGVARDALFRASPVRGRAVTPIGRAGRVLGASPAPGRLFVLQAGAAHHRSRLVEVDARTGHITDDRPFPGYDDTGQWRPAGVVLLHNGTALVLTRASPGGRFDLALAWDGRSVRAEGATAFVRVGSTSRLLGIADDQILTVEDRPDTCVDRGCPVTVLTVTHAGVVARAVQPPSGWTYGTTVVGVARGDPLVLVARVGEPARQALAWLLSGGTAGVLMGGTEGLAGSVAPVAGPDGSVLFAVPRPEGLRISVWLPGSVSAALLLDLPALRPGAELVCACR